eukprot:7391959-Prymnesium_polylepis.1
MGQRAVCWRYALKTTLPWVACSCARHSGQSPVSCWIGACNLSPPREARALPPSPPLTRALTAHHRPCRRSPPP